MAYGAALAAGVAVALASATMPVQAQSGAAQGVCLDPQQIRSTQIKDNRTILFQMRNGDVWTNTLVAECPGLKSGQSISQMVTTNRICAFRQSFSSNFSGAMCRLGAFTRVQ
jgi:hypothetical protein